MLVVDDQQRFREVAQEVIDATSGFRSVGCAGSGDEALDWLKTRDADLVVMDVRMPGKDGVAAALELAERDDRPIVVLCSSDDRPDIAADPRAHGADAFYCKERFGGGVLHDVWAMHR